MRLINADRFKQEIAAVTARGNLVASKCNAMCKLIDNQPTAFDVNKVIEQLEQQKEQYLQRCKEIESQFGENYESQRCFSKACSYDHSIQIVKIVFTDHEVGQGEGKIWNLERN